MYEVTVEAGFSSGHYLRNYKGKCENPHGHNYKIRVTLAGTELDPGELLDVLRQRIAMLRPLGQTRQDQQGWVVHPTESDRLSRLAHADVIVLLT